MLHCVSLAKVFHRPYYYKKGPKFHLKWPNRGGGGGKRPPPKKNFLTWGFGGSGGKGVAIFAMGPGGVFRARSCGAGAGLSLFSGGRLGTLLLRGGVLRTMAHSRKGVRW